MLRLVVVPCLNEHKRHVRDPLYSFNSLHGVRHRIKNLQRSSAPLESENMTAKHDVSVLFVCLGNICRSPLGEGVLAHRLEEENLSHRVRVDSAGTGAWHLGEPPDPRSTDVAMRHGITLRGQARRVRVEDFHDFDYIFAMDRSNLRDLRDLESEGDGDAVLTLFREFDPRQDGDLDVPDPYYGGADGFDLMFAMVDRTCVAFIEHLLSEFST